MFTRRTFLGAASAAAVSACTRTPEPQPAMAFQQTDAPPPEPVIPPLPARYGAITDEPFPVPAIPEGVVPENLWMQEVDSPFRGHAPGSIVIDPDAGFLHFMLQDGRALRYGVGTGAQGRGWHGEAVVQFAREWPRWKVPDEMIARRPDLEPYSVANGGMDGGPGNPLGARALYLFQNGQDTLYRIHGACEPEYLGQAVSSGCIRMLDQDVIDLNERVAHHAKVTVLPSLRPGPLPGVY
ncbi:L,D-transpeptidase [Pelagovum pacificum]|uniref:L,D-transpeptidase n=1 Tax=Pelagovum pacificum TaxID=2588711 RepID=A0A5C5GHF6_9RHOB|nr:L,D-transpeptidase [Pelagovum pacificum]QQA42821.1 L,D-transpeptidase [Pelagovum pacificum]TNY34030.1 L,D-transpeptidase [Pelagovum pacificum]